MKALDTNILIRFLVRDDEQQADTVYKRFKKAEADKETLFVPLLVALKTIWVLESVYELKRQEILDAIDELLLIPILEFEAQSAIRSFVSSAEEAKVELTDLFIACSVEYSGCECVITFDRRASKFRLFEFLK